MPNTPQQQLRRNRFEALIGLATPVLDLILTAGDRFSNVVSPRTEDDYVAIRPPGEKLELGSIRATRASTGDGPVE